MCITLSPVPPKLADELARLPISLAVWPGRVNGSEWHRESLRDERIFTALLTVVRAAPAYLPQRTPTTLAGSADVYVLRITTQAFIADDPADSIQR